MKLRCERDTLLAALTTASRAVNPRGGAHPVLSGIHLELTGDTLRVTGTNRDLTIEVATTVGGEQDGVAVVPSKLLADVVRVLPDGAVHLEVKGDEASIEQGRSEFSMPVMSAAEFPKVAELESDPVVLEGSAFMAGVQQVVKAASNDEGRPVLTGVLMSAESGGLRMVSTDSYRLALRDLMGTEVLSTDQSVLIPARALSELSRLIMNDEQVNVRFNEQQASFEVGGTTIITRLIEGEFPKYRTLIPEDQPNKLRVDRKLLIEAVRRVGVMAQDSSPIRLVMSSDGLELTASTLDVGSATERVDAQYEGEELTVAFNPEFLLDGVEAATDDEVLLNSTDALKPAVLQANGSEEFLYLLMPVRSN